MSRLPSLFDALAVGAAVGIVPLLIGFVPSFLMGTRWRSWPSFSAGMALGFLSLFFTDLIDDSGGLGESLGLALTPTQLSLAVLFFAGFGLLSVLAVTRGGTGTGSVSLAYLVAFGLGIHSMGEGMVLGNNLASQAVIEDLSTLAQGFSFALHKFLEGFTVGFFLNPRDRARSVGICAILAGLPLLFGIPLGFLTYPAILANFLFAAGAGAVIFIIVKVATSVEYAKHIRSFVLGFLVGFVLVYLGTLIHFMEIAYG